MNSTQPDSVATEQQTSGLLEMHAKLPAPSGRTATPATSRPRPASPVVAALLLAVSALAHAGDDDQPIDRAFPSPDGKYGIRFEGSLRGEGAYFLKRASGDLEILRRHVHYGPQITWLSDHIAELKFGCGSPCWESYYYDAAGPRLSPEYTMALAAQAEAKLVASIEADGVALRDMFSGRTLALHEMDTGAWAGLLVFCDPVFHFPSDREFRYSYTCGDLPFGPYSPGNATHTISIPQRRT